MMDIVLASGSPRRLELLQMIGFRDFKVIPDTNKEEIDESRPPELVVQSIALQKAKNISLLCGNDDIIIAADTLVYLDGRLLGKPSSPDEAAEMLRELSGRRHSVYTGIALARNGACTTATEKTEVFFRELSEAEISEYVKSGEPMDKAGAYAAQGRGAVFVERIEGDFFNVMGLPLYRLAMMLREFGVVL